MMSTEYEILLPDLPNSSKTQLDELLQILRLPRSVIASETEVSAAWRELPFVLTQIPNEGRNELIARMLIATSVGLFDGAINYIWNALIVSLRNRINRFGLRVISTILAKNFDETVLNEMRDSELLDLCFSLDLLSAEAYFFLSQCREVRNNFSSAHPNIALIDNYELITFVNRCCKFGLVEDRIIRGVDINQLLVSLKSQKLDEPQIELLSESIHQTYYEQQHLLIPMMYGIYCDPTQQESTRLNVLDLCTKTKDIFDDKILSDIVKQHVEYSLKQDEGKSSLSRDFFFKLNLVGYLSDAEQVSIVKKVIQALYNAHNNMYNFYNEPPFAEKLMELTKSMVIPAIVRKEYVHTVVVCYVGNRYGVSTAAIEYYEAMIRSFNGRDIDILLKLCNEDNLLSNRVNNYPNCLARYQDAVRLLDQKSVATYSVHLYEQALKGNIISKKSK